MQRTIAAAINLFMRTSITPAGPLGIFKDKTAPIKGRESVENVRRQQSGSKGASTGHDLGDVSGARLEGLEAPRVAACHTDEAGGGEARARERDGDREARGEDGGESH